MILSAEIDARLAEVPPGEHRLDLTIGARCFGAGLGQFLGEFREVPAERRVAAIHGLAPILRAGAEVIGAMEDAPAYRRVAELLFGVIYGLLEDLEPPQRAPVTPRLPPALPALPGAAAAPLSDEAAHG